MLSLISAKKTQHKRDQTHSIDHIQAFARAISLSNTLHLRIILKLQKTELPLQFECQLPFPSSILAKTCSSTFLTTYASYPEAKARSVIALTPSTIFTFVTCRWSSIAWFRSFQDKVNIGIASLDLKEASPIITLHWKFLILQIEVQLNR